MKPSGLLALFGIVALTACALETAPTAESGPVETISQALASTCDGTFYRDLAPKQ